MAQNKSIRKNGGFVGILSLLIVMAIIAYLMTHYNLFGVGVPKGFKNAANREGNKVNDGLNALDEARDAKATLEQQNRDALRN